MKQYLDLMKEVLQFGELKEPARPGMPRTLELFGRMMKFDLPERVSASHNKEDALQRNYSRASVVSFRVNKCV